ncbi:hypothetical protein K449DRAFT_427768 [Hypoxylon sp. EC38]|nr:hypothetical protein K449DRAFT_427768 [Hypoxylon sp. EC38]
MESFAKLKRRGTDLLGSLPHNLPSMPHLPHLKHAGGSRTMKGTWQHVSIPPLPRSSHSVDIVAGNAYIFGGECLRRLLRRKGQALFQAAIR